MFGKKKKGEENKKLTKEQRKKIREQEYLKRKKFCTTKSGKRKNYFTKETGHSIAKFIKCKDPKQKSLIFENELKKPFIALASNLIFVYKVNGLDNVSNLRDDCVRFLFMKIETFDTNRPETAFSYFNIIAKNWLFQQHNIVKRSEKKFVSTDETQVKNYVREKSKSTYDECEYQFFDKDFIVFLIDNFGEIKNYCVDRDAKVLNGVIHLLNHIDEIDIHNRKAAIIYLRDMLGMTPKQISLSLGRLKKIYYDVKNKWIMNN